MKISVTIKNVYGIQKIYPACEKSKVFAPLVGQKTLTERDIEKIKLLGYAIEITHPNYCIV